MLFSAFFFYTFMFANKKIVLVTGLETETVNISVSVMSCEKYVFFNRAVFLMEAL